MLRDTRKTILAKMDRNSYERVLILPSGLDNAYAGMLWHNNLFLGDILCVTREEVEHLSGKSALF